MVFVRVNSRTHSVYFYVFIYRSQAGIELAVYPRLTPPAFITPLLGSQVYHCAQPTMFIIPRNSELMHIDFLGTDKIL